MFSQIQSAFDITRICVPIRNRHVKIYSLRARVSFRRQRWNKFVSSGPLIFSHNKKISVIHRHKIRVMPEPSITTKLFYMTVVWTLFWHRCCRQVPELNGHPQIGCITGPVLTSYRMTYYINWISKQSMCIPLSSATCRNFPIDGSAIAISFFFFSFFFERPRSWSVSKYARGNV